jgi:hypothetical protein
MRTLQSGLIVLCLLAAGNAQAAEPPEAVVRAFALAVQKEGVAAAVTRYTHPDEAARFKEIFMPRIRKESDAGSTAFIKQVLGQELSLTKAEKMPPLDFLRAYLKSRDMRADGLAFDPPQFLGSGREGDVLHLIVRTRLTTLDGVKMQRMNVVSLKPLGDQWRMMLSPEMEYLALSMVAQK